MNPQDQQTHHHHMDDPDRGTPMNMLWGLILTLLTFLLIVVFVLSIDMFADASDPEDNPTTTPGDETSDPSDGDTIPDNPPDDNPDPDKTPDDNPNPDKTPDDNPDPDTQQPQTPTDYMVKKTENSTELNETLINSKHAILVDADTHGIVTGIEYDALIHTASTTKVMTLLVACERLRAEDLDKIVVIDAETVAQMTAEGASGDGLLVAEELTVRDLLYAIGLESDGIAAVALAKYIAGSEAAFVELMNKKAKEDLKLIRTTFENCTGLYHDNHRTTCREMASIMLAAMDNETVRTVLSTKIYETTTNLRPNGRSFESTYFIDVVNSYRDRGFQAQPAGGTVVAAKTGWVGPESGYCLVSYFVQSQTGKAYVAMTGNAGGALQYLQDHIMLYEDYTQQ